MTTFLRSLARLSVVSLAAATWAGALQAQDLKLHSFDRQQLTNVYYSEGANAGDVNHDGVADVVYGPYWFAGPDYKVKREIYPPVAQNLEGYADNFFNWIYDFNGDGWKDVFVVGFPGTPAYVYENPKQEGQAAHWKKHQVFDWVSNESPHFVNVLGDERPELVCTRDGFFGFATVNAKKPFGAWEFHPISDRIAATKFGHGLGVGDVNGDGRMDIIFAKGWFEQPEKNADKGRWLLHEVSFTSAYGGAEMYAYDVDGDGDNDVITSEAAHEFGLSWYEQTKVDGEIQFKQHLIMGSHASENHYGVVFSELHSVNLVDIDGDGLKDIVTGKTYWSHHRQSPMWDAGAVTYWFRLVRHKDGVDWVPYRADDDAGIGRQLSIADVNADGLPDIVVGGMKGAHVLTHRVKTVSKEDWNAAQPKVYDGPKPPSVKNAKATRGPKAEIDKATGRVASALEAESLKSRVSTGQAGSQNMKGFTADRWSGDAQVFWTGARPGDTLSLDLPEFAGTVDVEVVLTCARDYAIAQLSLDDQPLGDPIDLFDPEVITTGVLRFPAVKTQGQKHTLGVQIVGANSKAAKSFMVGIDWVRLKLNDGKYVAAAQTSKVGKATVAAGDSFPPQSAEGKVLNLDFETGTLADWTPTGNAFDKQPIKGDTVSKRRGDMKSNHRGSFWIGSYEIGGDAGTGTLTSAPFIVSHPYASFLTNGGEQEHTRVELIRKDTNSVIYKIAGENDETMRQIVVDLRAHVGKEIFIRLVDASSGGWGHLNFDHVRLHEQRPAPATPPLLALVADEYPHAGLKAEDAAAAMKLPEGFSVKVGAAEPDVKQPIAMALDDRGRVWIAEAYEYPVRAKGDRGRDRILIFEDTNFDGSLDKRTVFAEGLNLISGLEIGFGGVWVGAAPYLMFIPDSNGDDVPDAEPQILLDGWGYQDTHETLNAFIWGPDGWLYGCHGVFTHSRVGKPGTPDEQRQPINAGIWRYHPTKHAFEVFAHGTSNPWGVDFNDHGHAVITACVIPHLYHIIKGGRYQRQAGPHFNPHTYRDIVTIADHLHYLGATPHGGNSKSDAAGGGHAHAGAMIYLGDRWPEQYRNQVFMNNIHGQRLNVDVLKPSGSGYVGSHAPDFLLTGDKASQILNLRYGPDGNVWMIDWYDMQACHRGEVNVHDRSNGRIYKIVYNAGKPQTAPVDLRKSSDLELARHAGHRNEWLVRHSRRLLQERAATRAIEEKAVAYLAEHVTGDIEDTRRLRSAWALHAIGQLTPPLRQKLLQDKSPYVRGWTVQLEMEATQDQPPPAVMEQFASLAQNDDSPIVRLYLASAAQRIASEHRWHLLEMLVQHRSDAADHNLPLMYWYAAEPLAEKDPTRALAWALTAGKHIPLLQEFMLRRIGSSDDAAALSVLVTGLEAAKLPALQLTFLQAIRTALKGQRQVAAPASWAKVASALLQSEHPEVRLQATALGVTFGDQTAMKTLRAQVARVSEDVKQRNTALQSLLDANDPGLLPTLKSLLVAESPLRETAIRGLAQYSDPSVAPALLDVYAGFSPEQKRLALGTLCARAANGVALLKAVEAKKIPGTDLGADLVRQLQFLKSDEVQALLSKVWGTARESAADKLTQIAELQELVASTKHPKPDVELGRAVFAKTCLKCHVLYGVGNKIGPDLTGSNRSNLEYLLSNIVDPSVVMAKEYRPTVIATQDGRIITGLVKAEDAKSVTIQTSDSLVVVPLTEIEERVLSEKSMMPDDQLKQFPPHAVRSLIAYLQGREQAPMLATQDNIATLFNGRDLTGWTGTEGLWSVEGEEIVGRTSGLKRNEWLVSDLSATNFRFTVEVKLVANEGNSGIQFRSRAHDGEVSGYQADIGVGWWGKLYEEHGRALLWDKSGEEFVKPGDWNRYEIIASGSQIRTLINGNPCVDLDDAKGARRGIIAFQLHSGGKTEVRFRNLALQLLD